MAKVPFSKLGCKVNTDVTEIEFNGQKLEIKQYIPFNDLLVLLANIINQCQDDNNFKNDAKIDCFAVLETVKYFTNITFTEKQLEDPGKLYDMIYCSGLWETIHANLAEGIFDGIVYYVNSIFDNIFSYRNSVYAILDALKTDYNNVEFDTDKIAETLDNPDQLKLVKDILTKLG